MTWESSTLTLLVCVCVCVCVFCCPQETPVMRTDAVDVPEWVLHDFDNQLAHYYRTTE